MASDVTIGTYTRTQTFAAHTKVTLVVPGRGGIGSVAFASQCDVTWSYDYATEEVKVFHNSGETLQVDVEALDADLSTQPDQGDSDAS